MGGVVIGSTMELVAKGQQWLGLIINTGCNLDCPICYLGDKKLNLTMDTIIAKKIAGLSKNLDGIAIIGTEPLLDEGSVKIINIFSGVSKTHIMTNALNLEKFADRLSAVRRIDISLDGGPKTYKRGGSFNEIREGAKKWQDINGGELCVMHTISGENIEHIDDMLAGSRLFEAKKTFFSPYVRTLGGGKGATPVSVRGLAGALSPFTSDGGWKLMVDPYHAIFEWREWSMIKKDILVLPSTNRLIIDFDPGDRVRRIEVDGKERHPFIALHPGIKLTGKKVI